ncbi:hypothetical protein MATL_G00208660 [Megalops atlanticus]|uniref:Uncharacterized protein n=1 Tax=Megalops atlanticus TaxID=7932 RepID=A0A9D3PMS6_MEGAT|nr:hypothetical protein MATL_G00208660 [Megalops atlanticus]
METFMVTLRSGWSRSSVPQARAALQSAGSQAERACALARGRCIGVASEFRAAVERAQCFPDPVQSGVVTHILQAEEVVSVSGDNPPNTDAVPVLGPLTELPLFPAHSA